ncbi:MmgE/PrpD family protein [Acerihabitans sp. KWT182]|uniref:MmgE/PrpD family protein n=1 Tax=Acerihabitans sp. KWT182 TaxID=3157919 RepID=A0AAU7Q648_9GAMM
MISYADTEADIAACMLTCFAGEKPAQVLAVAAEHLADLLGVMMAGAHHPSSLKLLSTLDERTPQAGATARAAGHRRSLSLQQAALFNAFAAHVHDFDDDDTIMSLSHPTVTVGSACLALCEAANAPGKTLLDAYLVGVETVMRLGKLVNPRHYLAGWHATCTLGVVGAATAAGLLLGLNAVQLRHALGFAASMAGGLRSNFGSDAKPMQTGLAAAHGIMAARLAAGGLTSTPGSLLGPGGLVDIFAGTPPAGDALIASFGRPFALVEPGVTIKAYPCCTCSHAAVALLLEIMAAEGLEPQQIAAIDVDVDPATPGILIHPQAGTAMEAKFSLPFSLAIAALAGHLNLADFSDETVGSARVRRLAEKVRIFTDDRLPKGVGGVALGCRLRLTTLDGVRHARATDVEPGSRSWRLSRPALEHKFADCVKAYWPPDEASALFALLLKLEETAGIGSLMDKLSPGAGR